MNTKFKTLLSLSGIMICCFSSYPAFAENRPQVIDLIPPKNMQTVQTEEKPKVIHSTTVQDSYIEGDLYIVDKISSPSAYSESNINITNTYIGGDLIIQQYINAPEISTVSDFRGFTPTVL